VKRPQYGMARPVGPTACLADPAALAASVRTASAPVVDQASAKERATVRTSARSHGRSGLVPGTSRGAPEAVQSNSTEDPPAVKPSEALGLRWADVDLDSGTLTVRRGVQRGAGQGLVYEEPKAERTPDPGPARPARGRPTGASGRSAPGAHCSRIGAGRPRPGHGRRRVTAKEAPHLTPAPVADLLRAAEGGRYASLFALLVHTGLRRGEALALQWSDVDLAQGILRVRGSLSRIDGELLVTEPKTAKSKRFVPISEPAERLLREQQAAQERNDGMPAQRGARPVSCSPPSPASQHAAPVVAPWHRRPGRGDSARLDPATAPAGPAQTWGDQKVVQPPQETVRGRSGFLRNGP
jgi:hypothetical protein